jgi:hypothetical protein
MTILLVVKLFLLRVWSNFVARPSGPFGFRFFVQPMMAIFLAVRAGLRDGREGKPPFLWYLSTDPTHRRELVRSAWKDIGRLFLLALFLDLVIELIMFKWVYPGESLTIAFVLACVPYVLVRGPVNRLYRRFHKRPPARRSDADTSRSFTASP